MIWSDTIGIEIIALDQKPNETFIWIALKRDQFNYKIQHAGRVK